MVDNAVIFQFDKAADHQATNKARGTLTFLMAGHGRERHTHLPPVL